MRRLILVLVALAAASCSKPSDQDVANTADALRGAEISASQGSTPKFPELRSDLYCARFAAGAGAPEIEKSCKDQEAAARTAVIAMTVPAITLSNCTAAAEGAGGSYQVLKLCVENEQKLAAPK
jgi:hypothetical protein